MYSNDTTNVHFYYIALTTVVHFTKLDST